MLFPHPDSLISWVETADIYTELFPEREHFPFASFDKASPFFNATYKKAIVQFQNLVCRLLAPRRDSKRQPVESDILRFEIVR